ncbi:MAG: flagellar brake protein [Methylococcaceae bacterium]
MDETAKYLVRNQKQVFNYLKMLSAERCLISAAFGEDDKDTFLTAILDIDEKKKTITIDCGPKEYLNKRLLDSAIIKCATEYKGIKVQFEGRKVKKAGKTGQPAFTIPIPGSISWVQRRQFYRIKSPLSKNSYCTVSYTNLETEEETTLNLQLYDLSASGFSILNDEAEFSNQLIPSAEFKNCTLALHEEAELNISFEVRHKLPLNPNKPGKTERVGCYITNSSPRIESTILRYMQNIERELKQKE